MPLSIECPSCQRKLNVPDKLLGKRVKCPSCGEGFEASAKPAAAKPKPPPMPKDAISSAPTKPPPLTDYEVIDEPEYEKPAPRRRRPRDDDDEDEDERPRRRRRRDADDDDDSYDDLRVRRRSVPHRGGLILTLGIIAIPLAGCCALAGWVLGAITVNMANTDLAAIKVGRMDDSGHGLTMAGKICAIVAVVLGIINMIVGWFIWRLPNRF